MGYYRQLFRKLARGMIDAGGGRVNGEKVGARDTALNAGDCVVLQVGKRKFARVTLS